MSRLSPVYSAASATDQPWLHGNLPTCARVAACTLKNCPEKLARSSALTLGQRAGFSGADAGVLPTSKTGRTEPRGRSHELVFVRTEAIRLRHAVGGAVLTIANQCSACSVITEQASPARYASPVRVFCNRRGAERDTDAERDVD